MVDYLHDHVCDHIVDREPGHYHLAAVPMLVVLEQVDDDKQHLMDVHIFIQNSVITPLSILQRSVKSLKPCKKYKIMLCKLLDNPESETLTCKFVAKKDF